MNVVELNQGSYGTLAHYFETTLPLSAVTLWVIVAFQNSFTVRADGNNAWMKLLWPILALRTLIYNPRRREVLPI